MLPSSLSIFDSCHPFVSNVLLPFLMRFPQSSLNKSDGRSNATPDPTFIARIIWPVGYVSGQEESSDGSRYRKRHNETKARLLEEHRCRGRLSIQ